MEYFDVVVIVGCEECAFCQHGKSNLCSNNNGTTTDIGKGMGGLKHGGFQSHFPLPNWQLAIKLPDTISPDIGCMLPCSALTTYSSLQRASESINTAMSIHGRANLLVIGSGGLGIWTVINARAMFPENLHIVCADLNPHKLQLAQQYGADDVVIFTRQESVDDLVTKVTKNGSRKMDAVLDIVGSPNTQKIGFFCLHNGGTLVPIGFSGGQLALPIPNVIGKTISISGNRVGDIKQLAQLVALYGAKGLKKEPPVEFYNINDINIALDNLKQGTVEGRAILKF